MLKNTTTWIFAALAIIAFAPTASADEVTFKVKVQGAGKDDAVVSMYLVDDATGLAVWEAPLDTLTIDSNSDRTWYIANVETDDLPADWQSYKPATRVDARVAGAEVQLKQFKFLDDGDKVFKAKLHTGDIQGRCEWYLFGDGDD